MQREALLTMDKEASQAYTITCSWLDNLYEYTSATRNYRSAMYRNLVTYRNIIFGYRHKIFDTMIS